MCLNEKAWEKREMRGGFGGGMNNVSGFLVERLLVLMNN